MNIQKSRLTSIISVLVLVCSMVAVMVIPAAAVEAVNFYPVFNIPVVDVVLAVFQQVGCEQDFRADCKETSISVFLAETMNGFVSEDGAFFVVDSGNLENFVAVHSNCCDCEIHDEFYELPSYFSDSFDKEYLAVPLDVSGFERSGDDVIFTYSGPDTSSPSTPTTDSGLSKVVNKEMLTGVLNEVTSLLPIVIPVIVGFIGLRKGISFLQSILHGA